MSIQTVETLKTYFQTGDRPTQAQWADLIDSCCATFDFGDAQCCGLAINVGLTSFIKINIDNPSVTHNFTDTEKTWLTSNELSYIEFVRKSADNKRHFRSKVKLCTSLKVKNVVFAFEAIYFSNLSLLTVANSTIAYCKLTTQSITVIHETGSGDQGISISNIYIY